MVWIKFNDELIAVTIFSEGDRDVVIVTRQYKQNLAVSH